MKSWSRIAQSHIVNAVFDLATIAIVLPFDASGFPSAFGGSGFINCANRFRVRVFRGNNLLAAISEYLLVPDHGFEKPLQRPRSHAPVQCNGSRILPLHVREESPHIDTQQRPTCWSSKTICKTDQKLSEQFAQLCDIFHRHGATFRGFLVRLLCTRRVVSFCDSRQHQINPSSQKTYV